MLVIPETLPAPVALSILVAYFNMLLWIAYLPAGFLHRKSDKNTVTKQNSNVSSRKKKSNSIQPLANAIYAIE